MKHLVQKPHILFTTENPRYGKSKLSLDQAISNLKAARAKVYNIQGHYSFPKNSILIEDPTSQHIRIATQMAGENGQESIIISNGKNHKIIYLNGPNKGKIEHGKGTVFHKEKPSDDYSILPDGTIFTHNFGSEKLDKKDKSEHSKQELAPDQAKLKPLMKPYVSEAQRRWAHTPAGIKALGGKKAVEHWDKESKGKKLPERMEKALSPEELQAQGYKFKILQPTKTRRAYVVRVYHGKKPIGHLAYSDRALHPPDENNPSYGYHHVFNSYIEPEHRGKGIYQHMLRLAANHVKSLGSKGIMSEGYQRSKDATRAWDKVATHANPYTYHAKLMGELSPKNSDYYLAASEQMKKGAQGDWKKEGYTFAHYHNLGIDQHRIKAFAPSGEVVGSFIFENNNGKWMATSIQVKEPHRRKGLASAALHLFERKTGNKLHPHTDRFGESKQSPDAKALWAQPNRPFGKSEHKKALIEENFEPLQKGKKDILNMMGPKPEQHHHEFANWASKALPNSNWQIWAARHYKNKPEDFTPEIKQKLEHFGGSQHIPDIANVRFDKQHDLHAGLQMLENAEKQYHDKIKDNINVVKPRKTTTKFVQGIEKPNRHWFDLGVGSCENEGKAMGHCGNVPSKVKGDRILSLRTEHKIGNETYHEPHLTFIYNNGFLGEMKGRGNDKPAKHYHREIANLLKDPRIKGIIGEGHDPKNNFEFSDLSPELQKEVLQANPNLITSTDINNNENVEKILSIKDKLPEKHKNILVNIAKKSNLDPKHQEKLINHDDPDIKHAIAKHPDLDPKFHEQLVNDDDPYVRESIASNPNLDSKHQEKLVNDNYLLVKEAIARNPNLDPKFHEKLVNDDYLEIQAIMARKPNLDPKLHEQLVNSPYPFIKRAIASNPSLDPKYHEKLVNDDSPDVKAAIASNPNLDPKLHEKLVNDKESSVRRAIAKNPNLDSKLHEKLINDEKRFIRETMAANPNLNPKLYEKLLNEKEWNVLNPISKNPNLDPKLQEKLVNDENWIVRHSIAQNPNLDPKHYEKLANDKDSYVRRAIAENPSYKKWKEEQSKKLAASEKYNIKYKILTKSEENQLVKILENEKI